MMWASSAHGLCTHFSYGLPSGDVKGQCAVDDLKLPCFEDSFTGCRWVFNLISMAKWCFLRPLQFGCHCAINAGWYECTGNGFVDEYLSYGPLRVFTCKTLSDVIRGISVERGVETLRVCWPEGEAQYFLEFPMGHQWAKNYSTFLVVEQTYLGLTESHKPC